MLDRSTIDRQSIVNSGFIGCSGILSLLSSNEHILLLFDSSVVIGLGIGLMGIRFKFYCRELLSIEINFGIN